MERLLLGAFDCDRERRMIASADRLSQLSHTLTMLPATDWVVTPMETAG